MRTQKQNLRDGKFFLYFCHLDFSFLHLSSFSVAAFCGQDDFAIYMQMRRENVVEDVFGVCKIYKAGGERIEESLRVFEEMRIC